MWLNKAARSIFKIINSLSQAANVIGIVILAVMMLLTVGDVFMRYVFRRPIMGTVELTEYMMVCVVYFALAWCAIKGKHIKVDLVVSRFSPRVLVILDSITYSAGLGLYAVITWRSFSESISVRQAHLISAMLHVPVFPFYLVLSLGCAILCLVVASHLVQYLVKAAKG